MRLKQIEPVCERIGTNKFYITPFPAFKAGNITGELVSVLAPILGAIAPLVNGDNGLMDVDVNAAAAAMGGCTSINGDSLEKLMQKLLLGGHIVVEIEDDDGNIEPERLNMDIANELFCGDVMNMFVLCFHVIKINFNGFFKKLGSQSGKAELTETAKRTIL